MVNSCSAVNCTNRYKQGSNVTFHRFPLKNKLLTKKWVHNMRRQNFFPSKYTVLCSTHFTEESFLKGYKYTKLLKEDAVPTLFDIPSHLNQDNQWKKSPTVRKSKNAERSELKQTTLQLNTPTQLSISVSPSLPSRERILPLLLDRTESVSILNGPHSFQTDGPMHDSLQGDESAPDPPQRHTSIPDTFQVVDSSQNDVPIPTDECDIPTVYYMVSDAATLSKTPTVVSVEKLIYRNQEVEEELKKSKAKILEYKKKIKLLQQSDRRNKKRIEKLKAMLILLEPNLNEESEPEEFLATFEEMLEWSVQGCVADDVDETPDN